MPTYKPIKYHCVIIIFNFRRGMALYLIKPKRNPLWIKDMLYANSICVIFAIFPFKEGVDNTCNLDNIEFPKPKDKMFSSWVEIGLVLSQILEFNASHWKKAGPNKCTFTKFLRPILIHVSKYMLSVVCTARILPIKDKNIYLFIYI